MSEVVVPAVEDKAERKARKEQRKAEKALAKETVGEDAAEAQADSIEKKSGSSKRKRNNDALTKVAGDASEDVPKKAKKDKAAKAEKMEKKTKKEMAATVTTDEVVVDATVVPIPPAAAGVLSESSEPPISDSTLSDQAQKALQYVYLHKQHHITKPESQTVPGQGWKFNKARQNWCIRNYWNPVEVPEQYVELVLGYLETTVGAARLVSYYGKEEGILAEYLVLPPQNLIKQAQEYREKVIPASEADLAATVDGEEVGLEQGGVEGETETNEAEEPVRHPVETEEEEEEESSVALSGERKRRAELLLEKMRS